MPLFLFACPACHHRFEELVRRDETPPCPACGDLQSERQLARIAAPRSREAAAGFEPGSCGRCGDPRGPGACALDE